MFWSHVQKTDTCWLWTGVLKPSGHGNLYYTPEPKKHVTLKAHRASMIIHGIDIPKGMFVLHKCDNPKCVNPDHLYIGTHNDNMRDMKERGRGRNSYYYKTHCPKGHEYTPQNTVLNSKGWRYCKACKYPKHVSAPEKRDSK
jgi:hypothetical protein